MTTEHYLKLLPSFLRDFHDQKDFFKAMHTHYSKPEQENKIPGNWIDNHIYTIDFFLWFMARHGYRLQRFKSRHFEQADPEAFIQFYTNERQEASAKILSEMLNKEK